MVGLPHGSLKAAGPSNLERRIDMSAKPYTLESDQKATPVMIGTSNMLIWGDLVTKTHARMSAFLTTLAESFVAVHDAKILFLDPTQKIAPVQRDLAFIKLEEILFFYVMGEEEPLPEESETRRLESVEILVGDFVIEALLMKSPITTFQNLLLVTKDNYVALHQATVRHVAKPWLGAFSASVIQIRREKMTLMLGQS
jgi:hypothetical protein